MLYIASKINPSWLVAIGLGATTVKASFGSIWLDPKQAPGYKAAGADGKTTWWLDALGVPEVDFNEPYSQNAVLGFTVDGYGIIYAPLSQKARAIVPPGGIDGVQPLRLITTLPMYSEGKWNIYGNLTANTTVGCNTMVPWLHSDASSEGPFYVDHQYNALSPDRFPDPTDDTLVWTGSADDCWSSQWFA